MSFGDELSALYEKDILQWSEVMVARLKAGQYDQLDLEHLIAEVEALGVAQRKELLSRLVVLLEHLLKRLYVPLPDEYNGWERTIRNQRAELEILLDTAPSLLNRWEESFHKAWSVALKKVRKEYPQIAFPEQWPYPNTATAILEMEFWQKDSL